MKGAGVLFRCVNVMFDLASSNLGSIYKRSYANKEAIVALKLQRLM